MTMTSGLHRHATLRILRDEVKFALSRNAKMAAASEIEYARKIALHQVNNSAFWLLNFSKVRRLLSKMRADCLDA